MCNYISLCPASGMEGAQPLFSSTSRVRMQGWMPLAQVWMHLLMFNTVLHVRKMPNCDLCRRLGCLPKQWQLALVVFVLLYKSIVVFVAVPCQLKQIPK